MPQLLVSLVADEPIADVTAPIKGRLLPRTSCGKDGGCVLLTLRHTWSCVTPGPCFRWVRLPTYEAIYVWVTVSELFLQS